MCVPKDFNNTWNWDTINTLNTGILAISAFFKVGVTSCQVSCDSFNWRILVLQSNLCYGWDMFNFRFKLSIDFSLLLCNNNNIVTILLLFSRLRTQRLRTQIVIPPWNQSKNSHSSSHSQCLRLKYNNTFLSLYLLIIICFLFIC